MSQPDWLLYHEQQNSVWLLDYKTCDEAPKVRLETCPVEFQTWHMLDIGAALLDHMRIQFNLKHDTSFGGVLHVCVQKPSIDFGQNDRDYALDTSPLKSGPRKGQPRNEKVYSGEPRLENYISRCARWYRGEQEYEDKKPEREASPPVAISTTSAAIMTRDLYEEYTDALDFIEHFATMPPEPRNFFRTREGMVNVGGKLSEFALFFAAHPTQWPQLVDAQRLIVAQRDPDFTPSTPSGIYPRVP